MYSQSVMRILCACLALSFPLLMTAQLSVSGGLLFGPNFSTLKHDNESRKGETKTGYSMGLQVAGHVGNHLTIRVEALIERKGEQSDLVLTDIEGNPISEEGTLQNNVDYFVFPLTVQWRFGNGAFRYGPYAGAYLAPLIRQAFVFPLPDGSRFTENHTALHHRSDVGFIVGAGADWLINESLSLGLETRYNLGQKALQPHISSDRTWNRSLAVMAALRFSLGG